VATRWFTFFHYLNAHANGDGLAAELKLFMEENRMSLHNQFRSVDALALESFLGAKALMDETLWGDVSYKFEDVLGKVSSCCKASLQLGKHGRYVMYAQLGKGWDFECLLGYWLPNQSPTAAVRLGVAFTSNPKSLVRTQVIEAFRKLAEKSDGAWASGGLFDAKAWAWVSKGRDLPALMGPGDHVQAIKRHFLQLLNEVKAFKDEHPGLPWAVQGIDAEE
jgi:hypothetical protein